MRTWAPLWAGIVDSSIWTEPYFVRVLFTSLLALKDANQIVYGSAFQIASRAHMTEQEVLDGLAVLAAPDLKRVEPQPHDGRRIEKVDGGWKVLNGEKYQALMQKAKEEWRRSYKARKQKEYRAKKNTPGRPLKGELEYVKAEEEGAPPEVLDAIIENNLPAAEEKGAY